MSLRLSVLGLPVSLFATSALGFFANPAAVMASKTVEQPKIATVLSMAHNDAACYVTLVDEQGIKYEDVPAVFSVCKKEETLLNKKVSLAYNQVPITDCPTATECGRTKLFTFITQIRLKPIDL
ncbi:MAG: hypothetical protein AB1589_09760 [Cyanobacteriota bacterium]